MQIHRRAKLGPAGRLALCLAIESGMTFRQAGACFSVSPATAHRWWHRYRAASSLAKQQSLAWAVYRSSRPHRSPRLLDVAVQERICEVRRHTGWGPRLVAGQTGFAHSTVWKVLHRHGLSRRPRTPRERAQRYEWPCPGDLLHMDTARYARFERPGHRVTGDRSQNGRDWMAEQTRVGYDFVHAIVDDHSRLAYVELHDDEQAATITAFVARALAWFSEHEIHAKRLMTDNAWDTSATNPCASCSLTVTSSISAPSPTGRRPTARSIGSTRPWPANGPTASPTAHTATATRPCHTGSTTTTRAGHTAGSATSHPSAAFTTYVGRTASRTEGWESLTLTYPRIEEVGARHADRRCRGRAWPLHGRRG
jgi:transposase